MMILLSLPLMNLKLYNYFIYIPQEELIIQTTIDALLNSKSQVLSINDLFKGTLTSSTLSPREISSIAVKIKAASVVVVHNHPSGDPTPSPDDKRSTQVLANAGRVLDIPLIDHMIIGHNRYYSFAEHHEL